eukprot:Phypoly_transcript_16593.p1 GENE.Phypoly_transcript_16593~~Phypoly_transcript_16593.p1  ORF type:complete len:119 (+),score=10.33 Phypoly_transcript_16593:322-678(+)
MYPTLPQIHCFGSYEKHSISFLLFFFSLSPFLIIIFSFVVFIFVCLFVCLFFSLLFLPTYKTGGEVLIINLYSNFFVLELIHNNSDSFIPLLSFFGFFILFLSTYPQNWMYEGSQVPS